MGVRVNGVRLQHRFVPEQAVQNVDSFPDATGDKAAEESHVGVRNVMVDDAPISSITDVPLAQQVVLTQLVVGAVGNGYVAAARTNGTNQVVLPSCPPRNSVIVGAAATLSWRYELTSQIRKHSMRISMFSFGSRGDIQPMIVLGCRLKQAGHNLLLATSPDFADLAAEYGIDFEPLGPPLSTLVNDEYKELVEMGNVLRVTRLWLNWLKKVSEAATQGTWRLAQGSDAILFKNPLAIYGYNVAEKLGIPSAEINCFPVTRTRAFPTFFLGDGKDHGLVVNWALWYLTEQIIWQSVQRNFANKQRKVLNMPPLPLMGITRRQNREGMPLFYAYSPLVLPRPADWPERIHVTGYYFSDPPLDWQPPAGLLQFLGNGSPPVYIGLGSVPVSKPEEKVQLFLRALELSGQRAILASGGAGIGKDYPLPEQVLHVESIPHSWLFPRMVAIVHHGGAGTTGTSLRSGVPTIVTPVTADQPSWGERIHALGVGPAPLPFNKLTAESLAEAIRETVTNPTMRKQAAEVGRRLQAEDGPGRTIELFFKYVEKFQVGNNHRSA